MTLEQSPSYPGSGEEKFPPHRWFALGEEHSIFAESMDHPDVPDCVEYLSVAEHQALLREERARFQELIAALADVDAANERMEERCECCDEGHENAECTCFDAMAEHKRAHARLTAARAPVVQREEESR